MTITLKPVEEIKMSLDVLSYKPTTPTAKLAESKPVEQIDYTLAPDEEPVEEEIDYTGGVREKPLVPEKDILDKFIFSFKPISEWAPNQQGDVARNILETLGTDGDARVRNSMYLSSMFNMPLETAEILHDQMAEALTGKKDHSALSMLKEIQKYETRRKNIKTAMTDGISEMWNARIKGNLAGILNAAAEYEPKKTEAKTSLPMKTIDAVNKGVGMAVSEWLDLSYGDLGKSPRDIFKEWSDSLYQSVRDYRKANPEKVTQIFPDGFYGSIEQLVDRPEAVLQFGIEQIPQVIPLIATTLVSKGGNLIGYSDKIAKVAGLLGTASYGFGDTYTSLRERGVDPSVAFEQSFLSNIATAAIEQWSFGKTFEIGEMMFKGNAVSKRAGFLAAQIFQSIPRGGAEEGTQQVISNFFNLVYSDPTQNLFEGVGQNVVLGAAGEGLMATSFAGIGAMAKGAAIPLKFIPQRAKALADLVETDTVLTDDQKTEIKTVIADSAVKAITKGEQDLASTGKTADEVLNMTEQGAEALVNPEIKQNQENNNALPKEVQAAEVVKQTEPQDNVQEPVKSAPEQPRIVDKAESDAEVYRATNAFLAKYREKLGLNKVPSPTRRSMESDMVEAKRRGIVERAMTVAADIAATGRTTVDSVELAGLQVKAVDLVVERERIDDEIGKTSDIEALRQLTEYKSKIDADLDLLTMVIETSGSEVARMLNMRKLTLDKNLNIVTIKREMEALKGEKLSEKESKRVDDLFSKYQDLDAKYNELRKKVEDMDAMRIAREISGGRRRMGKKQDIQNTVDRIKQLLDEGCMN